MKVNFREFINFIKFGIVGVSNTLINWFIFFVLNNIGINYIIANIIAYSIATSNSYIWNSLWVFKYKGKSKLRTTVKFIILNIIGLGINTLILYVLVDMFNLEKMISVIIATIIVMILNYFINKFWVFKKEAMAS